MSRVSMMFHNRITWLAPLWALAFLVLVVLILCLSGCPKPQTEVSHTSPEQRTSSSAASEIYSKSKVELEQGNYKQAHDDYQEAVDAEPSLADKNYQLSILYTWAIAHSQPEDVQLLEIQRELRTAPDKLDSRRELMLLAVYRDQDIIRVIGVGTPPSHASSAAQRRLMARRAAVGDAYAWVARLAMWSSKGIEGSFDVSGRVVGAEPVAENWIEETVFAVKVEAPLKKNMPQ